MKHTYVSCPMCSHWSQENRRQSLCKNCNNSKEIVNPKEMLCNMCGECLCPHEETLSGKWISEHPQGLINIKVTGGYESYHLLDMNRYTFSICEKCLRKMFIQFKIKPIVDGMDFQDGIRESDAWEKDQEYYEYRVWKDAGLHHQAYLNKICNVKKDCTNAAIYTIRINNNFSEDCSCEEHKGKDGGSYKYVKFIPNVLKPFL